MFKKGLSANIKKDVKTSQNDSIGDPIEERIKVGRVIDIILNDKYPKFKKYGGDSAIGTIKFKPINFTTPGESFAKPFFPKGNDAKVADAILELFRKRENLEIFNKKVLYIYIREIMATHGLEVKTPKITKIANKLYGLFKNNYVYYLETGYIDFERP